MPASDHAFVPTPHHLRHGLPARTGHARQSSRDLPSPLPQAPAVVPPHARLARKGALLLAALLMGSAARAAVITVHPGEKAQDAINRASNGDEIRIERGRYVENLKVDRTVTLKGIDLPTIDGSNKGDTIRVTAEDVVIEGLKVINSGDSLLNQNAGIYIQPGAHRAIVRNCYLSYNLFGLWIEKANDVQVLSNNITGKRDYDSPKRGNGVELYNTKGARIIDNEISFVRDALYIDVSHHAIFQKNRLHHSRYGTHVHEFLLQPVGRQRTPGTTAADWR